MKKSIVYHYSNGKRTEHTIYIKKSTMLKECEGAKMVDIYEKTKGEPVKKDNGVWEWTEKDKFITTLLIQ